MNQSKIYFHTFDALRFFSFLLVFLHHSPFEKPVVVEFFTKSGGIGVSFFFVLSGFLITYLLLYEKQNRGRISLKNFFLRRILRIWPLFFAMILFAFLTPYILNLFSLPFSSTGYQPNWWMSIFFLENYQMMILNEFPNVSPLGVMWSLCIEEHYYIIWGLLLFFIPIKNVPLLIIFSIIIGNIGRIVYYFAGINTIDIFSNIDFFATGAIPAYLLICKNDFFHSTKWFSKQALVLVILITLLIIIVTPNLNYSWKYLVSLPILSFLFSVIISFTLLQKSRLYIPDNVIFSKLGIYTYGLYLYHTICINFIIQMANILPFQINWLIGGILSLILTIIVSIISYHIYEKQFLKLKKYFY